MNVIQGLSKKQLMNLLLQHKEREITAGKTILNYFMP